MLSILPSQRGNSELCRDAVACDGPPSPCPRPADPPILFLPPSPGHPLLPVLPCFAAPLARGVCSPLSTLGSRTLRCTEMHRDAPPRTPQAHRARDSRRLVFEPLCEFECRAHARDLSLFALGRDGPRPPATLRSRSVGALWCVVAFSILTRLKPSLFTAVCILARSVYSTRVTQHCLDDWVEFFYLFVDARS